MEPYTHGVLNGVDLTWYENGLQSSSYEYRNGQLDGMVSVWWKSGNLMSQSSYINGQRHGPSTGWYYDGTFNFYGLYANGNMCGIWTVYSIEFTPAKWITTDYGACSSAVPPELDPQAKNTSAKVSGVVYDARTSSPIGGASVNGTLTASDGSYSLTIGHPNTYNLSCTKPGYDRFVTTLTMEGIQLRASNIRLKKTVSTNLPSVTSVEPIQPGIYPAPAVLQGPD